MRPIFPFLITLFLSINSVAQSSSPDYERTNSVISAFFQKAKWEIANLQQVKKELLAQQTRFGEIAIAIEGYTDTIGTEQYNAYLADFRLKAVSELAQSLGIKVNKKQIAGESAERPLEKNRRVDIFVEILIPVVEEIVENVEIEEMPPVPVPAEPEVVKPQVGVPILTNIEFENGTAWIIDYSYRDVDKLFFVMMDFPNYNIELHGHVCCTDNYRTSLDRAWAVKTALIRKGIAADRISVFGHSNNQPLVPETSEKNKQRNRRVEAVYRIRE